MALQPAVEDVLDEGRVIYQDLWEGNTCEAAGEGDHTPTYWGPWGTHR